jgi:hypothetical protein
MEMLKDIQKVALVVALLLPGLASAYEPKTGVVKRLSMNSPAFSNRNVIVELEGVTSMCAGGSEQGYFNKADTPDTFAAFIATLLAAQAASRPVLVFTTIGSEGCRIDQIQLAS